MNRPSKALIAAALWIHAGYPAPLVFYVSPSGSDSAAGTLAAPFRTPARARDALRPSHATRSEDAFVYFRKGTYYLDTTLQLSENDGGGNGTRVHYQAYAGERAVLSGGFPINGWKLSDAGKNIWSAKAPAGAYVRHLFVNGRRAVRAVYKQGKLAGEKRESYGHSTTDPAVASWTNIQDIEFVYRAFFLSNRCKLAAIRKTPTGYGLEMAQPEFAHLDTIGTQLRYRPDTTWYIENAYEFLDQEGEWYWNRGTGVIYYKPLLGEDMSRLEAVAGHLDRIVSVEPGYYADKPADDPGAPPVKVAGLVFSGLTFMHATDHWMRDAFYRQDAQGNVNRSIARGEAHKRDRFGPAAVFLHGTTDVTIGGCDFSLLGGAGICASRFTSSSLIEGNRLWDISSNGIQYGDPWGMDSVGVNFLRIRDNLVRTTGVEYPSAIGIMGAVASDNVVEHNEVGDLTYSGISNGWQWNDIQGETRSNRILNNYVWNVSQKMSDAGGVYGIGPQQNTVWDGNYVKGMRSSSGCLFPDQFSSFLTVRNSVCEGTGRWLHVWTPNIHDINISGIYWNKGGMENHGTRVAVSDTHFVAGAVWPKPAADIIATAGLETAFRNLGTLPALYPLPAADPIVPTGARTPPGAELEAESFRLGPGEVYFTLNREARVTLELLNGDGRRERTVSDARLPAGAHKLRWADAPPGGAGGSLPVRMRLLRLRTGTEVRTRLLPWP